MQNGRGIALTRSTAGVITSLGMVLLLIALIVVPAGPVLAATPTLDVTTACDNDDNLVVNWTTTSTDPTPGGGTADGAVTVTESLDYDGSITETVIIGEYNDANGYQMSGSFLALTSQFVPGLPGGFIKVTVDVVGFNDGTGQASVVMSAWTRVTRCKDGTTTSGATTTTAPVTISASVAAACVLEEDVATYPITVTVSGDEGATGVVTINGVGTAYVIDGSGEAVVAANGNAGDNQVDVVDDVFGSILSEVIALQDCGETTTSTEAETTTTTEAETTTTTEAETTTTTEASSTGGSPPVSVLPTQVDQTELPQTGIDNGPLATMGVALLLGGAGMLIIVRKQEGLAS